MAPSASELEELLLKFDRPRERHERPRLSALGADWSLLEWPLTDSQKLISDLVSALGFESCRRSSGTAVAADAAPELEEDDDEDDDDADESLDDDDDDDDDEEVADGVDAALGSSTAAESFLELEVCFFLSCEPMRSNFWISFEAVAGELEPEPDPANGDEEPLASEVALAVESERLDLEKARRKLLLEPERERFLVSLVGGALLLELSLPATGDSLLLTLASVEGEGSLVALADDAGD